MVPDWMNTALVTIAFGGSIGMSLVFMACAHPKFNVWWPFFNVLFYLLAPVPTLIARRYTETTGSSNSGMDLAIFITMFFFVSSFAFPLVIARAPVADPLIQWPACYLTLSGSVVIFATLIIFFFYHESSDYDTY